MFDGRRDLCLKLKLAQAVGQLIIVAVKNTKAKVSMYEKCDDGSFRQILATVAYIGKNGLGKSKEGDGKTPVGIFHVTHAFGICKNPDCHLPYVQVDDSFYWVDDPESSFYNQFVSTNCVTCDWKSAEHIIEEKIAYQYVLALDYNKDCTPELGSAIFMHCAIGRPTLGCIAIPEMMMYRIMSNISKECIIVIEKEKILM